MSDVRVCNNRSLRAVVFDMDGVIIDSHPVHRRAWKEFLHSLGHPVSEHELGYILEGRKRREILCHFLGELPEDKLSEYGKCKDEFFQRAFAEVRLVPGVAELLECLLSHGVMVAVATSASRMRTHSTLTRLHLQHYFAAIVTGDDVIAGKPDPTIYRTACQQLAVVPSHALAVEDAVPGIEAAVAAGMSCIGVIGNGNDPAMLRRAGAKRLVQDFNDVSMTDLAAMLA